MAVDTRGGPSVGCPLSYLDFTFLLFGLILALMTKSDELAAELVARCLTARNRAHALHLTTKSYAEHKALEFFYTEIADKADEFAEVYQGATGCRLQLSFGNPQSEAKPMLAALRTWIMGARRQIGPADATHLQNIIDEIVAVIDRTCYLLCMS